MILTNGIPGSLQLKRGRYYYKYTFPGEKKPTMKAMIPPGMDRATDNLKLATEIARLFYLQKTDADQKHDGTIGGLLKVYCDYCDEYYFNPEIDGPTDYLKLVRRVMKFFGESESDKLAGEYTSLDLKEYRGKLLKMTKSKEDDRPRYCRKEINRRINIIIKFFKWAESEHHVPANTTAPMIVMDNVKPGFMGATDKPKVKPVDETTVDITCQYAPPVIRDMIRIMQLTGMRPKELCQVTPAMIDRTDDIWSIDYDKHKTAYLGKDRFVFFGPDSQAIIAPYLLREQDAYLFSPRETCAWRYEQRRKARITPEHLSPAPKGVSPKIKPCYTTQTFRRAMMWAIYAAQKAGEKIDHWYPYQLRHAFGTKMGHLFGTETSAAAMGNNVDTAKIYIEKRKEFARQAAKKCG